MYFFHFPPTLLLIVPLFGIASLFAAFFRLPGIRLIILMLFTSLIIAELISIYFNGGFIDYQFFVNLNVRDINLGLSIFRMQAILAAICFGIIIVILFWLTQVIANFVPIWLRLILLMVFVFSVVQKNGPLAKLMEIYQITTVNKQTFQLSLKQLSMANYVTKSQLKAKKGKNIVVISLESFERGFLDNPAITPNLKQLSAKYTYYPNMPMTMGSSWTTASMYTYMTGVPFLIGDLSSSPMDNAREMQLVSLGDVLGLAGYQMHYVLSSPNFSGMGNIISMFGMDVVSEETYPNQYPVAPFGLYDRDIFDIAKKEITKLSAEKAPFALFISTISTHAPYGFKDERMRKHLIGYQDNMDFVAASLDYNVGGFISFLEESRLLDNTVFYIFPDHLMMGISTPTIAKLSAKPRSLYMMTNVKATELDRKPDSTIYQINLPRLILKGAKVETNAKFLADYLAAECDISKFIVENKRNIAKLNRSAAIDKN